MHNYTFPCLNYFQKVVICLYIDTVACGLYIDPVVRLSCQEVAGI
jgi:hypothetical protein